MADVYLPNDGAYGLSTKSSPTQADAEGFERPRVITLCGSTRFMDEFERQNRRLTLEGNVVLSVATKAHEGGGFVTSAEKTLLDRVHREKIRLSDEIFVIDVGGYIGPSTNAEIEFAKRLKKPVRYLSASGAVR